MCSGKSIFPSLWYIYTGGLDVQKYFFSLLITGLSHPINLTPNTYLKWHELSLYFVYSYTDKSLLLYHNFKISLKILQIKPFFFFRIIWYSHSFILCILHCQMIDILLQFFYWNVIELTILEGLTLWHCAFLYKYGIIFHFLLYSP